MILCPPIPEIAPRTRDSAGSSSLTLAIIEGPSLNVWAAETGREGRTKEELTLELEPDQTVVIGRQEGGEIEYLDPLYRPTQLLPNSSQRVVHSGHNEPDNRVSRGHFMLKGSSQGIVLVNGVPRQGGGLRPPLNGTLLLEPENRKMLEGESYVIERGASATICLPNGTVVLLGAA